MWIKEYVFNSLLPVIHILIYTIFVTSATDLVDENPLYAVACIAFIIPAEKFIRKMFGFDKASSVSQIGAAAGGAMVMNAINKINSGGNGGKSGGKAGGKSGAGSGSSGGDGSSTRPNPGPNNNGDVDLSNGSGGNAGNGRFGGGNPGFGDDVNNSSRPKRKLSLSKGAANLGKQYINKANGRKALKGIGRGIRKGAVGALGAATLGTVGIAAGVASGDLGNIFKYGAAGAAGGFAAANKLGDKAAELEKMNRDTFMEGALGTKEYKTQRTIRELYDDNDFNQTCKSMGITGNDRKKLIREFANNGITDAESIKKAITAGATNDLVEKDNNNITADGINTMIGAAKIRQQATKQGMSRQDVASMPGVNDDILNLIYSM